MYVEKSKYKKLFA